MHFSKLCDRRISGKRFLDGYIDMNRDYWDSLLLNDMQSGKGHNIYLRCGMANRRYLEWLINNWQSGVRYAPYVLY